MGSSRKLDAMFAEKVLGCKVKSTSASLDVYCGCDNHAHDDSYSSYLRYYTQSLDAAWEGVDRCLVDKRYGEPMFSLELDPDGWSAQIHYPGLGQSFTSLESSPAKAIVVMCLLAVGVTEQEVEEAEKEKEAV